MAPCYYLSEHPVSSLDWQVWWVLLSASLHSKELSVFAYLYLKEVLRWLISKPGVRYTLITIKEVENLEQKRDMCM